MKQYSASQICQANDRYYSLTNDIGNLSFWNWLGLDLGDCPILSIMHRGTPETIFQIPDKAVHRMDLMLSPHYRTLFKAYQICNGLIEYEPLY